MPNEEEIATSPGLVLHNPDGTLFEGVFDERIMSVVTSFHTDDGQVVENVVVRRVAAPVL